MKFNSLPLNGLQTFVKKGEKGVYITAAFCTLVSMNFTLVVSQKKNGTFDHVVRDEQGVVLATRNSTHHYTSATVVCKTDAQWALIQERASKGDQFSPWYVARVARGNSPGVVSFNSKPTKPRFDCKLLGYAIEQEPTIVAREV